MNVRGCLVLCTLLAVVAMATAAGAQPPIHQVGDHWSAWDAPAPPEGAQVITVEPGDTLWSIAERVLGDPYLWPQLWEQNKYVLDAEWIYPGDPIFVSPAAMTGAEGVAGPSISELPEPGMPSADDPYRTEEIAPEDSSDLFSTKPEEVSEAPVPLGFESDIYCTGYVGELNEELPYSVTASEHNFMTPTLNPLGAGAVQSSLWSGKAARKLLLGLGDIVYLKGGSADGLSPGMLLTAVNPEDKVIHPVTGKTIGRFYRYQGRLRVLSVQESSAIAEISFLCDPILLGTGLKPFEPEPVPLRRVTPLRPVNFPSSKEELAQGATIIATRDKVYTLGAGHLVLIDHGFAEDVAPGDIYTIYRQTPGEYPAIVLGEIGVLSVFEKSSLARILRSRYAIYVGDGLVLK